MRETGQSVVVVDNGSWRVRAGFSTATEAFSFPPLVSRFKDRKSNENFLYCGHDVFFDSVSRASVRRLSDQNSALSPDLLESLFDYTFLQLGLNPGRSSLDSSIFLCESFLNIRYNRKRMMELLYDCYNVPSISFGIDSLLSFAANGGSTGLVLSCGHNFSSVLPVFDGVPLLPNTVRLNWGGARSISHAADLLTLKYPTTSRKISSYQAENVLIGQGFVAPDYNRFTSLLVCPSSFGLVGKQIRLTTYPSISPETKLNISNPAKDQIVPNTPLDAEPQEPTAIDISQEQRKDGFSTDAMESSIQRRDKIIADLIWHDRNSKEIRNRRHAASKARMRELTSLAGDGTNGPVTKSSGRQKPQRVQNEVDDSFGIDDKDWLIYQDLDTMGYNDSFLTDGKDLFRDLEVIEQEMRNNNVQAKSYRCIRHPKTLALFWGEETTVNNTLTLNVERTKPFEPFFNPALGGIDAAGLPEIAANKLKGELGAASAAFGADIFLTGGCTLARGFQRRMAEGISALMPETHELSVRTAHDPLSDAWRGSRIAALESHNRWISKSDWNEGGADYCLQQLKRFNSTALKFALRNCI